MQPQLGWNVASCIGCLDCVNSCPESALRAEATGITRKTDTCVMCGKCVTACPSGAMFVYGRTASVSEILDDVEKDAIFYARSGGGLTLSGGEPLFQPEFARSLLIEARKRHINRAMETSAFARESIFLELAGLLDYLFVDVKCMDSGRHLRHTGQPNERILSNIRALRKEYPQLTLHLRTPVIPGFNDTEEDIVAIASFAKEAGASFYELLPYHKMGESKYACLSRHYPMADARLDEARFKKLQILASNITDLVH